MKKNQFFVRQVTKFISFNSHLSSNKRQAAKLNIIVTTYLIRDCLQLMDDLKQKYLGHLADSEDVRFVAAEDLADGK